MKRIFCSLLCICSLINTTYALPQFSNEIQSREMYKPDLKLTYPNEKIYKFHAPKNEGERYTVIAPDTIDLRYMAELVTKGLTDATINKYDLDLPFYPNFSVKPATAFLDANTQNETKFREALPLMRNISGSNYNIDHDKKWMEITLSEMDAQGILEYPLKERPWIYIDGKYFNTNDPQFKTKYQELYENAPWWTYSGTSQGRLMSALSNYYAVTGDELWKEAAIKSADGMIAFWETYKYFYQNNPKWKFGAAAIAWPIKGITDVYRATGYQKALDGAKLMTEFLVNDIKYFNEDGSFAPDGAPNGVVSDDENLQHMHMHSYCMLAILDYAIEVNDLRMMQLVSRAYDYALKVGDYNIGFFPEGVQTVDFDKGETCSVADMLQIAIKLSKYNIRDCYDEADKWTRNMFYQSLLKPENIEDLRKMRENTVEKKEDKFPSLFNMEYEDFIGCFAGFPVPNEWWNKRIIGWAAIQQCCTGNCARALYSVWDNVLTENGDNVNINLLMNYASNSLDIFSYIPYEGKVEFKTKKQINNLSFRIPDWTNYNTIKCKINGKEKELRINGRKGELSDVPANSSVIIEMDIPVRETKVILEKGLPKETEYTITLKGNNVVKIDPFGRSMPLYKNYEEKLTEKAPMKEVIYYIPKMIVNSNDSINSLTQAEKGKDISVEMKKNNGEFIAVINKNIIEASRLDDYFIIENKDLRISIPCKALKLEASDGKEDEVKVNVKSYKKDGELSYNIEITRMGKKIHLVNGDIRIKFKVDKSFSTKQISHFDLRESKNLIIPALYDGINNRLIVTTDKTGLFLLGKETANNTNPDTSDYTAIYIEMTFLLLAMIFLKFAKFRKEEH